MVNKYQLVAKGKWFLFRESRWEANSQIRWLRLEGPRHVDYPIRYSHSGLIAYDFPERVPLYVKLMVAEYFLQEGK